MAHLTVGAKLSLHSKTIELGIAGKKNNTASVFI
jgi:hypothetical protein